LYVLRNPEVRDRFLVRYHEYKNKIESYLSEILKNLDEELTIPIGDLAAIVDWGSSGLMELSLVDPSQTHVLATFLDVINHGAFRPGPRSDP
jgi:hypothetical protein